MKTLARKAVLGIGMFFLLMGAFVTLGAHGFWLRKSYKLLAWYAKGEKR